MRGSTRVPHQGGPALVLTDVAAAAPGPCRSRAQPERAPPVQGRDPLVGRC